MTRTLFRFARRLAVPAAVCVAVAAPAAFAAEAAYDFVVCSHSKRTMLEAGPDGVAFGFESWGVVASSTTPTFEKASTHCVGSLRVTAGKPVGKGLCKWFLAGGDTAYGEWEYTPASEARWTWLAGAGKLKGIGGSGTFQQVLVAPPADPGTGQDCRRDWGKITLP
jgi:hypothetical protein